MQRDGEINEFSVFLRQILQSTFRQELGSILIQPANALRSSLDPSVDHLCERTADSQMYWSSSLFLLTTRTLFETKWSESNATPNASSTAFVPDLTLFPKIVHKLILGPSNTRILNRGSRFGAVTDDFDENVRVNLGRFQCWSTKC